MPFEKWYAHPANPVSGDELSAVYQDIGDQVATDTLPDEGQISVNWLEITSAILGLIPLFGVTYVVLYARIVKFEVPAWLVVRR